MHLIKTQLSVNVFFMGKMYVMMNFCDCKHGAYFVAI
jgi:hypothetical protein